MAQAIVTRKEPLSVPLSVRWKFRNLPYWELPNQDGDGTTVKIKPRFEQVLLDPNSTFCKTHDVVKRFAGNPALLEHILGFGNRLTSAARLPLIAELSKVVDRLNTATATAYVAGRSNNSDAARIAIMRLALDGDVDNLVRVLELYRGWIPPIGQSMHPVLDGRDTLVEEKLDLLSKHPEAVNAASLEALVGRTPIHVHGRVRGIAMDTVFALRPLQA
jgi:hypothetical protein